MNQLGQQLKRIRLERGLTQREVAEQLGMEQNYISRYESGDRPMDHWVLNEVAQILNVRYVQGFEYLEEEIHSLNPQELFDEILPTKTGYDIALTPPTTKVVGFPTIKDAHIVSLLSTEVRSANLLNKFPRLK